MFARLVRALCGRAGACRGVVMLFNAIAKAQKAAKDAAAAGGLGGAKAVKLNKVSFLAQLKSATAAPGAGAGGAAAAGAEEDAGGWKVLNKGYTGGRGDA